MTIYLVGSWCLDSDDWHLDAVFSGEERDKAIAYCEARKNSKYVWTVMKAEDIGEGHLVPWGDFVEIHRTEKST